MHAHLGAHFVPAVQIEEVMPEPAVPAAAANAAPKVKLTDIAQAADLGVASELARKLYGQAWAGDWNAEEALFTTLPQVFMPRH